MSSVSFTIDRPAHQRRCRAALEQLQVTGPQLPQLGDRPRVIADAKGHTSVWISSLGRYIGID